MRIDKDALRLMQLVDNLKRRRIFVSLLITRTGVEVSYWDRKQGKVVTVEPLSAMRYLRALDENDRRELECVGCRMGAW